MEVFEPEIKVSVNAVTKSDNVHYVFKLTSIFREHLQLISLIGHSFDLICLRDQSRARLSDILACLPRQAICEHGHHYFPVCLSNCKSV